MIELAEWVNESPVGSLAMMEACRAVHQNNGSLFYVGEMADGFKDISRAAFERGLTWQEVIPLLVSKPVQAKGAPVVLWHRICEPSIEETDTFRSNGFVTAVHRYDSGVVVSTAAMATDRGDFDVPYGSVSSMSFAIKEHRDADSVEIFNERVNVVGMNGVPMREIARWAGEEAFDLVFQTYLWTSLFALWSLGQVASGKVRAVPRTATRRARKIANKRGWPSDTVHRVLTLDASASSTTRAYFPRPVESVVRRGGMVRAHIMHTHDGRPVLRRQHYRSGTAPGEVEKTYRIVAEDTKSGSLDESTVTHAIEEMRRQRRGDGTK